MRVTGRKCHHTIHLERSLSLERDRAWHEWKETPRPHRVEDLQALKNEAETAYREEMLAHYCKVNRVTRRRCERDYEDALPPDDIRQLRVAKMDYGPFTDDIEKSLSEERQKHRKRTVPTDRMSREELEHGEVGFQLLPDHECPWDTAMWRDTF